MGCNCIRAVCVEEAVRQGPCFCLNRSLLPGPGANFISRTICRPAPAAPTAPTHRPCLSCQPAPDRSNLGALRGRGKWTTVKLPSSSVTGALGRSLHLKQNVPVLYISNCTFKTRRHHLLPHNTIIFIIKTVKGTFSVRNIHLKSAEAFS